jgi:hypothetical protein
MARAPVWTTSLRAAFMAMEPVCLRAWPSIISLFETAQKNSRGRNSGRLKVTVHPISQNVSLFFLQKTNQKLPLGYKAPRGACHGRTLMTYKWRG